VTFVKRDGQFYKHCCHIYVYLHFFKSADFDCNIQKSTVKLRLRNRKKTVVSLPIVCLRNTENDFFSNHEMFGKSPEMSEKKDYSWQNIARRGSVRFA